jgi:hypothetical protein
VIEPVPFESLDSQEFSLCSPINLNLNVQVTLVDRLAFMLDCGNRGDVDDLSGGLDVGNRIPS